MWLRQLARTPSRQPLEACQRKRFPLLTIAHLPVKQKLKIILLIREIQTGGASNKHERVERFKLVERGRRKKYMKIQTWLWWW